MKTDNAGQAAIDFIAQLPLLIKAKYKKKKY
jgi:hypothetical protein